MRPRAEGEGAAVVVETVCVAGSLSCGPGLRGRLQLLWVKQSVSQDHCHASQG